MSTEWRTPVCKQKKLFVLISYLNPSELNTICYINVRSLQSNLRFSFQIATFDFGYHVIWISLNRKIRSFFGVLKITDSLQHQNRNKFRKKKVITLCICRLDSYYYGANIDSHLISFSVYFCIWLASKVVYRNHFEYSYNVYKCNKYRSTTMWLISSQNDNKTRATKLKLLDFAMQ